MPNKLPILCKVTDRNSEAEHTYNMQQEHAYNIILHTIPDFHCNKILSPLGHEIYPKLVKQRSNPALVPISSSQQQQLQQLQQQQQSQLQQHQLTSQQLQQLSAQLSSSSITTAAAFDEIYPKVQVNCVDCRTANANPTAGVTDRMVGKGST